MRRKLFQHILFWLVFYSISLYNDLYLSASFALHPTIILLLQTMLAHVLLYFVKTAAVYTFLYYLIPRWIDAKAKTVYYIQGFAILITGAILMRLTTQQIIWKYIYGADTGILTAAQTIARFFYSLLDLAQICAIATAIKLFRLRLGAMEKEKKLVKEKLEAEMHHLRSQTNPHFLFNTLNSIFSLSRNRSEQTPDAVMKLSKILRYMLYETAHPLKALRDELNVINDYVQLQQLRFGDRIRFDMQKEVDNENTMIGPLLLLPLIENAYKHGNHAAAFIRFHIRLEDARLSVKVENLVAEISVADEAKQGIGLGNIRRQLELLYKDFSLSHEERNGIFIVNLDIDLSSYAKTELFDTGG